MAPNLLDRNGEATLPEGYLLIETEVDFLRNYNSGIPLLIRGDDLCDWAIPFFNGRDIIFNEIKSIKKMVMDAFPALTPEHAKVVCSLIMEKNKSITEITSHYVLQTIYPMQLWDEPYSIQHGAKWLLWLIEKDPPQYLTAIIEVEINKLKDRNKDNPLSMIYSSVNRLSALQVLNQWLGINPNYLFESFTAFPEPIPKSITDPLKTKWRQQIIESNGQFFENIIQTNLATDLKLIVVDETAEYLLHHKEFISEEIISRLAKFLSWDMQKKLQNLKHPLNPNPLPDDPEEVINWYIEQYLPYRLAVFDANNPVNEEINTCARNFANWYLKGYPQALHGSQMQKLLSFNKTASLASSVTEKKITLLIVLDGLCASDGDDLYHFICFECPRLTSIAKTHAFAPLPTVTEFCKTALFTGVPYSQWPDVNYIGTIIPENSSPISFLQNADRGGLYLWRILEPDRTYHKHNNSDTLMRDVEAQLEGVARKIQDIIEKVASDRNLEIIVTTDHGRLLNYSQRSIQVPKGMQSHGRAAWGNVQRNFEGESYQIDGDVVFLYPGEYGLTETTAIVLNDQSFRTNDGKRGKEAFPHGGLFPEEVIIPWLVFERDVKIPQIQATLSGKNAPNRNGEAILSITNLDEISLSCLELNLLFGNEKVININLNTKIYPMDNVTKIIEFSSWPSDMEIRKVRGSLIFRSDNGLKFMIDVIIQLESDDMYKLDNILEGLD